MRTTTQRLRERLAQPGILRMPGCYNAISARLVELAGFDVTFMSGFSVAGSRLALPDAGLISYAEMLEQIRQICEAVSIPVFGDGDTGFGNAMNVKRTVQGYAGAGVACIMIEDQVHPKRCGHVAGKAVVPRDEAVMRVRAACDARDEGADILIMARTDARATDGLDEAIARANAFVEVGADITFVEAPQSADEMVAYCESVPGPKMCNLIEQGRTPILSPDELEAMGYAIAVYPLTLFNASLRAMQGALAALAEGRVPDEESLLSFDALKVLVGFSDYAREEARYKLD